MHRDPDWRAARAFGAASPAGAAFPGAKGRIALPGYQRIDTINAAGGDRQPLIGQSPFYFAQPAWSLDGQRIAFGSNREGVDSEIYVIGAGGTGIQTLTTDPAEDSAPVWSPDGRQIAFESDRGTGGSGRTQIYVMNADGSNQHGLSGSPADDRGPAWSPDGTRIAFARGSDLAHDIWVAPAAGGVGTPLTTTRSTRRSPTGRRAATASSSSAAPASSRWAPTAAAQTPIAGAGAAGSPAWSPDGTRIAFERDSEIFSVQPDGGGLTPLTAAGTTALIATNPDWQPIPPPPPSFGPAGRGDDAGQRRRGPRRDPAARRLQRPRSGHPTRRAGQARRQDRPGLQRPRCPLPAAPARDRGVHGDLPGRLHHLHVADRQARPARRPAQADVHGPGLPGAHQADQGAQEAAPAVTARAPAGRQAASGRRRAAAGDPAGHVGRAATWKIRAPKTPKVSRACMRPGASRPTRCPI